MNPWLIFLIKQKMEKEAMEFIERSRSTFVMPNVGRRVLLHYAAESGLDRICLALLKENPPINLQDNSFCTPLFLATDEKHLSTIEILLDAGADPTIPTDIGFSPYGWCIKNYFNEGAELFCLRNIKLNVFDAAALASLPDLERLFAENPKNIYLQNPNGWIPIFLAHSPATFDFFVQRGVDINTTDDINFTLLHLNIEFFENVQYLLRAGANPNIQNNCGDTPLHDTASIGLLKTYEELLKFGGNPDLPNNEGLTPKELLKRGISINWSIVNKEHQERIKKAQDNEKLKNMKMLREFFANKEAILSGNFNAPSNMNE